MATGSEKGLSKEELEHAVAYPSEAFNKMCAEKICDMATKALRCEELESLLAVAVAERDEAKRLLAECWGIFSADEMARIENGKADIARDPDLMKRISVFFRKTAAKGVE